MLPPDHPRRPEFEALTRAEEAAGLYAETATIGFKLNWDRLLDQRALYYEGHVLKRRDGAPPRPVRLPEVPTVHRHKTALARYELSKPVRTVIEYGLLRPDTTFFDYATVMARLPKRFVNETLWPEFVELNRTLANYIAEVTERVIAEGIGADSSEVEERPEPRELPATTARAELG